MPPIIVAVVVVVVVVAVVEKFTVFTAGFYRLESEKKKKNPCFR